MNKRVLWSRVLCIVGLAKTTAVPALLFGYAFNHLTNRSARLVNVLELTSLTLPVLGGGLVAIGSFLGRNRYRVFLYGAPALTACALAAFLMSFSTYFETPGPAPWWVHAAFTYPIGVGMSCVGAVLVLIESFHGPSPPKDNVERY